jgi:hypothetical protein
MEGPNMDALATVTIVTGFGAMFLLGGWAVYRLWRAGIREDRPFLMDRMFARQGVSLEGVEYSPELEQMALAARRCVACGEWETCRAWLEGEGETGYEAFCPNADLIARLKAEQARGRFGWAEAKGA